MQRLILFLHRAYYDNESIEDSDSDESSVEQGSEYQEPEPKPTVHPRSKLYERCLMTLEGED